MKALTVWQPWASLIMIGAKPNEFRTWDYRERNPRLVNERIVIHAGVREMRPQEIAVLIQELEAGRGSLVRDLALPLLRRVFSAHKCRGVLPLGAVLGTVTLGKPFRCSNGFDPDSDRIDHHKWAWPVRDPDPFVPAIEWKGKQGFWDFPMPTDDCPRLTVLSQGYRTLA
jgi:hypothetical protein